MVQRFLASIGDVCGQRVLDLGCGNGLLSIYLAQLGAEVVAIDTASQAIDNLRALATVNGVEERVDAIVLDAQSLADRGESFDLVIGQFILHHVEPFDAFVPVLARLVRSGGRGLFYENSSRNRLLMLLRGGLPGRLGIPKNSDSTEYPLEPSEVEQLRVGCPVVSVDVQAFVMFHYIAGYLAGGRTWVGSICDAIDKAVYRLTPFLRRYSYHQVIRIDRV